jgi:hypothetical protein
VRPIAESTLDRWRKTDASQVLERIAEHAKRDPTYVPITNSGSTRWHVSVSGLDYELLVTGPKFWDCRANRGGGGALDLVMFLTNANFKAAARKLKDLGL